MATVIKSAEAMEAQPREVGTSHNPTMSTTKKQWVELFKEKSKPSNSFKLQKWEPTERSIKEDELRDFGHCLVGFILGRFPGIQAIEKVRKSWGVECTFTVHESGWLVFKFRTEVERDDVMEKGPYESFGAAWVLKPMPRFFSFDSQYFTSIPTWVRLQGLPLDLWSQTALGKIVSHIGNPITADLCTAEMVKTSYARVLVEVDITKPLVRQVVVELPNGTQLKQQVTYEREPRFCAGCRMMGHVADECRRKASRSGNITTVQTHKDLIEREEVGKSQDVDMSAGTSILAPISPKKNKVPEMVNDLEVGTEVVEEQNRQNLAVENRVCLQGLAVPEQLCTNSTADMPGSPESKNKQVVAQQDINDSDEHVEEHLHECTKEAEASMSGDMTANMPRTANRKKQGKKGRGARGKGPAPPSPS